MTQVEVQFEEVTPIIDGARVVGMMLYGTAVLASADSDDEYEFYVKSVELDTDDCRGMTIGRSHFLFRGIAAELQNDSTKLGQKMQDKFSAAVEEDGQPDPDAAREERRERVMEDAR